MSNKCLEDIKEQLEWGEKNLNNQYDNISNDDIECLIQQAERGQELERKNDDYAEEHSRMQQLTAETALENNRLKNILYAVYYHCLEDEMDMTADLIRMGILGEVENLENAIKNDIKRGKEEIEKLVRDDD